MRVNCGERERCIQYYSIAVAQKREKLGILMREKRGRCVNRDEERDCGGMVYIGDMWCARWQWGPGGGNIGKRYNQIQSMVKGN